MSADMKKMISLLNEWDPVKLVRRGAPADEYSGEARMIYEYIDSHNGIEADELAVKIHDIFEQAFNGKLYIGDMEVCKTIAEMMLEDQG